MNKQKYLRLSAINLTRNTIQLASKENRTIDYSNLLIEIMAKYGTSKRTSQEYMDVARSQFEINNEHGTK